MKAIFDEFQKILDDLLMKELVNPREVFWRRDWRFRWHACRREWTEAGDGYITITTTSASASDVPACGTSNPLRVFLLGGSVRETPPVKRMCRKCREILTREVVEGM